MVTHNDERYQKERGNYHFWQDVQAEIIVISDKMAKETHEKLPTWKISQKYVSQINKIC